MNINIYTKTLGQLAAAFAEMLRRPSTKFRIYIDGKQIPYGNAEHMANVGFQGSTYLPNVLPGFVMTQDFVVLPKKPKASEEQVLVKTLYFLKFPTNDQITVRQDALYFVIDIAEAIPLVDIPARPRFGLAEILCSRRQNLKVQVSSDRLVVKFLKETARLGSVPCNSFLPPTDQEAIDSDVVNHIVEIFKQTARIAKEINRVLAAEENYAPYVPPRTVYRTLQDGHYPIVQLFGCWCGIMGLDKYYYLHPLNPVT